MVCLAGNRNRRNRCLYDFVPTGLRDPVKYDEMFRELTADETSSTKGYTQGIDAYYRDDGSWQPLSLFVSAPTASIDRSTGLIKLDGFSKGTRFLNPAAGCACQVSKPFRFFELKPSLRVMLAVDDTTAHFWRSDSVLPATVAVPKNAEVGIMVTDRFIFFGYEENPPFSFRHLPKTGPLDRLRSDWPVANMPGMVRYKYTDEDQLPAEAFKVSTDITQPLVLEDIQREAGEGCDYEMSDYDILELPVIDQLSVIRKNWDLKTTFQKSNGEFAICEYRDLDDLNRMREFLQMFKGDARMAWALKGKSDSYMQLGRLIVLGEEDDSVELHPMQKVLKEAFTAFREDDLSTALLLLNQSGLRLTELSNNMMTRPM